jgi:UDPglucose 6-dehydrogenase
MNITYVGGAGRLGFPLALWSSQWHDVTIADINQQAISAINDGTHYPYEPIYDRYDPNHNLGSLYATDEVDMAVASDAELIFVIVPTPSNEEGDFNIDYVLEACQDIGRGLVESETQRPAVVIVSTVNPGDCEGRIKDKLERFSQREEGVGFDLVYSPEFVRQGSIMRDFANPDFILLGCAGEVAPAPVVDYYDSVTENSPPFYAMSLPSAEITKLGLNCAVTTKMVLANQLAWLCHLTPGADARDVLPAIGQDKRIGNAYFSPGPPPGGPCFPRDVRALAIASARRNVDGTMPLAVDFTRRWQMSALMLHLGTYGSYFNTTKTLILGQTYKPGVNITEEAAGNYMREAFEEAGFPHATYDPALDDESIFWHELAQCDLIVIATDWPQFKKLEEVDLTGKVIFDLWSMLDEDKLTGCKYIRLGRHEPVQVNPYTGRPQR